MKPEYVIALAIVVSNLLTLIFVFWENTKNRKHYDDINMKTRMEAQEIMSSWSKATFQMKKEERDKNAT